MKKRISVFFVIGILVAFVSVCTVGLPNISSLKFGINNAADPARTTFTVGEDIYAVVAISNIKQPVTLKHVLTAENVDGVTKGQVLLSSSSDIPDARTININFLGLTKPGDFKFEATLIDNTGKVVDTKSGIFTLTPKSLTTTDGKTSPKP